VNRNYLRLALASLVCVGGCSSVPVRYYTLTAPPGALPASETTLAIDVRVVHFPPQLNRTELMVRTGASEVTLLENERWASPVDDEIKEALRLELRRRLSQMTALPHTYTRLRLDIDVQHLEAELGRYALFEASWGAALSSAGQRSAGAPTTHCTFQSTQKIQAGYAGMVEGYQRGIEALADAIVAAVSSPASGSSAACKKSIEQSAAG
jgi:uncharacterized protein